MLAKTQLSHVDGITPYLILFNRLNSNYFINMCIASKIYSLMWGPQWKSLCISTIMYSYYIYTKATEGACGESRGYPGSHAVMYVHGSLCCCQVVCGSSHHLVWGHVLHSFRVLPAGYFLFTIEV